MIGGSFLNFGGIGAISSFSARTISTSQQMYAIGFVAASTQISSVKLSISSVSSSPVFSFYIVTGDNSATTTSTPNTSPTTNSISSALNISVSSGIFTITGFSEHTLTPGVTYWIVAKYISGGSVTINSASNLFVSYATTLKPVYPRGSYRTEATSSTEPVTWGSGNSNCLEGSSAISYTDGTIQGFVASSIIQNTANRIYHTNDLGSSFKGIGQYWISPKNSFLNIVGCGFSLRRSGSPTGRLYADLYVNGSFVSSSANRIIAQDTPTLMGPLYFLLAKQIAVPPNSEIMWIVKSEVSSGDNGSNHWYPTEVIITDDEATNAELPLRGKFRAVTFADGVITKLSTKFWLAEILLDQNNPFAPAPLNRRKIQNQR